MKAKTKPSLHAFFLAGLSLLMPHLALAQTASDITDLILVTGQSNVLGSQTNYDPTLDAVHDRVFAFTTTRIDSTTYSTGGTWQQADLHQAWDVDGWHPGNGSINDSSRTPYNNFAFHFAKTLADSDPNKVVGIVVASAPGQGIQHWDVDGDLDPMDKLQGVAFDYVVNTQASEALAALSALGAPAAADGFDAILWHQGETDWLVEGTSDASVLDFDPNYDVDTSFYKSYYPNKLNTLISRYRNADWFNSNRPFICGETKQADVNIHLMNLNSDGDPWTGCVIGNDLPTKDGTHFSDVGLRTLGQRYAQKYLQMTQLSKAGTIRIMAVGDSITEGYTPDNGTGTPSYRQAFSNWLVEDECDYEMVGRKTTNYLDNNPQNTYYGNHEGYSGQRANHIRDSLNWDPDPDGDPNTDDGAPTPGSSSWSNPGITAMVESNNPNAVLLHIGTNDIRGGNSVSSTANEIDDIIQLIHAKNPETVVFIANMIPSYPNTDFNANVNQSIAELGDLIESTYADPDDNIHVVDVRSAFQLEDDGLGNQVDPLMQDDQTHPNNAGEQSIADAFAAVYATVFSESCGGQSPDLIAPETFIIAPALNEVVPGNTTYDLTGNSTDTGGAGFKYVGVALKDLTKNQWYNFSNNSFNGATGNGATTAVLTNTTATYTNWIKSIVLPNGNYRIAVRTTDNANNQSPWSIRQFTIASDNTPPTTTITSPSSNGQVLTPGVVSLQGTASDSGDSGFKYVGVALKDLATNQWYNFSNNSFTGASGNGSTLAQLQNTSASSTDWSKSITLPSGRYRLAVRTTDNANNQSPWTIRLFSVSADNEPPTTTITSPSINGQVLATGEVSLQGTASDTGGAGFKYVGIALKDLTTNQWFNFSNNSFSGASGNGSTTALLQNTSDSLSDWSKSISLPDGNYRMAVRTTDNANNQSPWTIRVFSVDSGQNN